MKYITGAGLLPALLPFPSLCFLSVEELLSASFLFLSPISYLYSYYRLPPSVIVSQTKSFPPLGWLFYLNYRKVASNSWLGFGFNTQPQTCFLSVCCLCAWPRPMQFIGGKWTIHGLPPPTPKSDKRPLGIHTEMPSFLQILSPSIALQALCDQKKEVLKTQAGKSLSALG